MANIISEDPVRGTYTTDDGTEHAIMGVADPIYNALKAGASGNATGLETSAPEAPSAPLFNPDAFAGAVRDTVGGFGASAPEATAPAISTPAASPMGNVGFGSVLATANSPETSQFGGNAAVTPRTGGGAASGTPGQVTEGTTTTDSTQTAFLNPAMLKKQDALLARNSNNLDAIAGVHEKVTNEQASALTKQAGLRDEAAKLREAGANRAKEISDAYQVNLDSKIKELEGMKIQPKGMFEDDNLGQNLTAGIAIMLGALGGAMSGSNQNVALGIMEKAIDRDLDAQKANLGKKKDEISMLQLKYNAARQAGMDDTEARLAVKEDAFKQIGLMFEARKATLEAPLAKQAAEAGKIAAETHANDKNLELTKSLSTHTEVETKKEQNTGKGGKLTEQDQNVLRDAQTASMRLKDLRAGLDKHGGVFNHYWNEVKSPFGAGDTEQTQFEATAGLQAMEIGKSLFGALSEKEHTIAKTLLPDPGEPMSKTIGKLNALEAMVKARYDAIGKLHDTKVGETFQGGERYAPLAESPEERNKRLRGGK